MNPTTVDATSRRNCPLQRRWHRQFHWAAVALTAVVAGVCLGCGSTKTPQPGRDLTQKVETAEEPLTDESPAHALPPVSPEDFVGSQACVECHSDIAEVYAGTHSMSHAMAPIGEETPVEDFQETSFQPSPSRTYQVLRDKDHRIAHQELIQDAEGTLLFETTYPVGFALGSGRRGRSYLINREGLLFQSPISWYTQPHKWALAPGYQPLEHMRFDRRISKSCLFCHAGRIEIADYGNSRMTADFLKEGGIGCERCHGAGRQHVENQQQGIPDDSTIVNPVKLATAGQRDSVCYQCHLRAEYVFPRRGLEFADFRPGLHYEDVMLAFVHPDDHSVVQQFRSSVCFQKSAGKLGCISCHDPHSRPTVEERPAFYREKCMQCHADRGCSLPEAEQNAEPAQGSCIHCHMPPLPTSDIPHTALTDHSLARHPSTHLLPSSSDPNNLQIFRTRGSDLSATTEDRAYSLLLATGAAATSNPGIAQRAVDRTRMRGLSSDQVLSKISDDIPALERLGLPFMLLGQPEVAEKLWKRTLELRPTNEHALQMLARFYVSQRDLPSALRYSQKLVEANPYLPEFHWLHAHVLDGLGRSEEAIEAAQTCLQLDPTAVDIRKWLVEAYRKQRQFEQADEQVLLLRKLEGGGR